MRWAWCVLLVSAVAGGLFRPAALVVAADEVVSDEKRLASRRFAYFKAQAQAFQARLADGTPTKLATDSVLNWTIERSWHGSFFIWTAQDRPVLVGCFLADSEKPATRRTFAEFHQMTADKLEPVRFNGVRPYTWQPDARQCETLPTETPVGADARTRLREMREIAREASVTMYSEDETSREQLRLLTQPLYRYPERKDGADGALFGYVTTRGTDPEFLLAVETSTTNSGKTWLLRPMRSCTRRLELLRDGKQIWSVAEYDIAEERVERDEPYAIFTLSYEDAGTFEERLEAVAKGGAVEPPTREAK